jgi:hypothetical protein
MSNAKPTQDVSATYNHRNMGTWKQKVIKHKSKASREAGRNKGPHCQSSPLQRSMAKRSRAYKHPEYSKFCKYWDGLNNSRMGAAPKK